MNIDGSCHCGNITYEASVDPKNVGICHCTDCQTLSASSFRTFVMSEIGSFKILSGSPKTYVKIAESGSEREQAFCPECGSAIYSTGIGDGPKVHNIRLGTVTQRDQLTPKFQVWNRSAQEWLCDIPSIPAKEKQ